VRTAMSYQHPHTLNLQAKLDALQTEQLPVFDGLGHTLAIPGNC
jgi:hypothetical protein